MLIALSQLSFAAGELTPALWGRLDLAKVQAGLKTARNVSVLPYGGVASRPGLAHVVEIPLQGAVRPMAFVFGVGDTTVLVFGHRTLMFLRNGAFISTRSISNIKTIDVDHETLVEASGVTQDGDLVFLETPDKKGVFQRLGLFRASAGTGGAVALHHLDGTPAPWLRKSITRDSRLVWVYTLGTPYESKDLPALNAAQSYDVMILTHPDYAPRRLSRQKQDQWSLTALVVAPGIRSPSRVKATPFSTSAAPEPEQKQYAYVVTAISENDEESLPSTEATCQNNLEFHEAGKEPNTNKISWSNNWIPAVRYRVYRKRGGVFGLIGATDGTEFTDNNIGPDSGNTPPTARNPFKGQDDRKSYPHAVTFFEQCMILGGSESKPQTIWTSGTANFFNFTTSIPVKADQAITFTLASARLNAIRHFAVMRDLLAFTTGGEWLISGGDHPLAPTTVRAKLRSYYGCTDLPPLMLGERVLFVNPAGTVQAIGPNTYDPSQYSTTDLSLLSAHLFEGKTIVAWAYAPDRLIWAVRDDGVFLSLTFLPEHEVMAWCRHDTDGVVESVVAVPESAGETTVYMVVRRKVGGADRRFVERLAKRYLDGCTTVEEQSSVTKISGLFHLEGCTVTALADGNVIPGLTVSNASVTLPRPAREVQIGRPYVSEIETLPISFVAQGEVTPDKPRRVTGVTLRVLETRGLWGGPNHQELSELKPSVPEIPGDPPRAVTGTVFLRLVGAWRPDVSVVIQQRDPLPMTILTLTPETVMP